ncbi:MAG: IPT/TIG domain-containing protein [Acidimicrobiales bacterium]
MATHATPVGKALVVEIVKALMIAPTVSAKSPTGPVSAGTVVTITGTNLVAETTERLGTKATTRVTVVNCRG